MIIVAVYKTGGDFTSEYVYKIKESLPEDYQFLCLTDEEELLKESWTTPLEYGYEKWWSKLEMFKPSIKDDVFYLDLDTIITEDITEFLQEVQESSIGPIMLSDFYRPERLASGVMYIPKKYKNIIWKHWCEYGYEQAISTYRGDQEYLESILWKVAMRFDMEFPDTICSYKAHIIKKFPKGVRPLNMNVSKCKIVCFHGNPRPADVSWTLTRT